MCVAFSGSTGFCLHYIFTLGDFLQQLVYSCVEFLCVLVCMCVCACVCVCVCVCVSLQSIACCPGIVKYSAAFFEDSFDVVNTLTSGVVPL